MTIEAANIVLRRRRAASRRAHSTELLKRTFECMARMPNSGKEKSPGSRLCRNHRNDIANRADRNAATLCGTGVIVVSASQVRRAPDEHQGDVGCPPQWQRSIVSRLTSLDRSAGQVCPANPIVAEPLA